MKLLAWIILAPTLCMASLKYPSDRLKVMDIETLQRIVANNLNAAQRALNTGQEDPLDGDFEKEGEVEYTRDDGHRMIRESLELVFAKPEQNYATSTVYTNIEAVAAQYGGILGFLEEIADQGVKTLDQDGKDTSLLRDQNTYIYILNNMMAEIKPLIDKDESAGYKKLITRIRDEDIEFSDSLKSYRILNSMSNITNPSKVAESIVGKPKCSWWEFLWCWS
ncbi:MAG: hypothetical protein KDD33_00325 [Bdellovibrionales bacterium]|nr:hypothetical protein [Bdellovibrionales bacterium]